MVASLGRRKFLIGSAAASFVPRVAFAQSEPLRLGLLMIGTGPLAEGGLQMQQGLTLYLKERNYVLAGRKVELTVADTGGNPAGAKNKAQELVERDKVDIICGPFAAFEMLAITDYVQEHKIPTLALAGADDVTQRKPNPYFLRSSATSSQAMHPLGDYARKEMKLNRVATLVRGFRLRLREYRRLPAGLRGRRRARRQETVAAARHRRLHALPRADRRASMASRPASPARTRSSS